ncbi:MAG: DHH family phosphoesterase [Deltaproteobacteria bacterium]|nr:DHH family phosphoesterase [Deltaproteobacteria bacterium]
MARRIIVCDGAELARLWSRIGAADNEELFWVPREEESRARPPGFRALPGGVSPDAFQKLNAKEDDGFALVSEDAPFVRAAVAAIVQSGPSGAPLLVLSDDLATDDLPEHPCLRRTGLRSLIRDDVDDEFDHLNNLQRVTSLRRVLGARQKIAILLQPDPDPDGIACGYALRVLLGRNRTTAPLVSFGEVTRPENRAMVSALGMEVRRISPEDLDEFDALALLDVQPPVFGESIAPRLRSIDVVVDHHPERSGYDALVKDIRTSYGATSSILTEYVRAAALELHPKLATALLYGIKTDTQLLGRETSAHDIDAFAYLHSEHSPALLRRIERPALPTRDLRALGRALTRSTVEEGVHLLVLGRVREDVIPQVADLALQAEGADWAVAAGFVGPDLVFSVRNVGHVRAAGDVVRAVVEGVGVGGGHRSMAKGIIPLKAFRKVYGGATHAVVRSALLQAFIAAIRREEIPRQDVAREES